MSETLPGTRFGPYEVISPLGAGGMGQVWKSRDTRVDRIVAIKVGQKQFSERFEREARAIAALNHPNICALYDVGPDYLVMEYVDGAPIRPVQNVRKLLDLAAQIADGLAAAHDRGITHRDLKPENILVTADSRVKILDFGLAKQDWSSSGPAVTQASTITQPGMVLGTVAYMSPEQARGEAADARSDHFSFGTILYELASGKRPFARDSAPQTMAAIIEADPEPLPQTVPAPLKWMIERCLAKEPWARYESTRDLHRDLIALRDHISEFMVSSGAAAAVAPSPTYRRWLWPAAAVIGAVILGAAGYWSGLRQGRGPGGYSPVPLTSSGGDALNPAFSPDGREVVFVWSGPRNANPNLYVKLIGSNDLLRLTNDPSDETSPAWSPDGQHIAFLRSFAPGKWSVMLISPLGGSERKLTEVTTVDWGTEGHSLLAWTPDSRYLAASHSNRLELISIDTAERQALTSNPNTVAGDVDPAFSADGRRIAFVRRLSPYSSRPFWIALNDGYHPAGPPQPIRTEGIVVYSPQWVRADEIVLASGAPGAMWLYRVNLSNNSATRAGDEVVGNGLALHRETGRLIYTSLLKIENLYRIAVDGPGKITQAPERASATTGVDMFPEYSPDGGSVAFTSLRFGEFGVWTMRLDSGLGLELAPWRQSLAACGDWSPDGKSVLAFANGPEGRFQIYKIAIETRKVTRLLNENAQDIFPTYSRDGKTIYFTSSRQGPLQLYRMASDGGPASLVTPHGVVQTRESRDGRWLYFADWAPSAKIYRMPATGGEPSPLVNHITSYSGWTLSDAGVYYWDGSVAPDLRYRDLESGRDTMVWHPSLRSGAHLALSPDGHWLCFPLFERNSQELMMLEGWR